MNRSTATVAYILTICAIINLRPADAQSWTSWGRDLDNSRNAVSETAISNTTVTNLGLQWTFVASGSVRGTPAVDGNDVFLTAMPAPGTIAAGMVYRLDAGSGLPIWAHPLTDYGTGAGAITKTSPAITSDAVIIGIKDPGKGAFVAALGRDDGSLRWKTRLDPLAAAAVNGSAVIAGTMVIVGTASSEEEKSLKKGYTPRFRGTVQALDLSSGSVLWSFSTVPVGYTGGAVWGNNIAVDLTRNTVFASTGNNYTVPAAATACLQSAVGEAAQHACLDPMNFVDSVVALDLTTGA
jgi:polyvinyl alcohol dehydrogenase (cytochrome)